VRYPVYFKGNPISPSRLVSFSDGIFAIAITLLVFNLKIPDLHRAGIHQTLAAAIAAMVPQFMIYVLSFLLIAVFWSVHHHMMNHIHHVDNYFIWLNLAFLLGISFLPFPTALQGNYPNERFALIFYIGSMSYIGFTLLGMWSYASYRRRLVEKDLPVPVIRHYFKRGLFSQLVFAMTIVLALIRLDWGQHFLLVLIPLQFALQFWYKKELIITSSKDPAGTPPA
jgi:uncharacterized membrane protein